MTNIEESLHGRDFISLGDFSAEELYAFWDKAAELKRKLKAGQPHEILKNKTLVMLFEWPSTRTRLSFETGMQQLGGHAIFVPQQAYWGKEMEPIKDSGRVMSRYAHGIVWRCFHHEDVVEMAKWASVPVINANTDFEHPCQVMADLMTTKEYKGKLKGVKTVIPWSFTAFPKPIGIVNSTLYAGSKVGMDVVIACPEGYDPDESVLKTARKAAKESGGSIEVVRDMKEAVKGADVVHVKGWSPPAIYRQGFEKMKPPHVLEPAKYKHWIVTEDVLDLAKKDVIVQHALPVVRGEEATEEVMDGPRSVIIDEAENRLHAQKGVMAIIMR